MIAILLATYNGGQFLQAQLDSYHAQTRDDWAVTVSDDGSDDDSPTIIQNFAHAYPDRVGQILTGPGRGFAQNFLHLLNHTPLQAEYVAFSDQDDVWLPDKLDRAIWALDMASNDQPALYASRRYYWNADRDMRHPSPPCLKGPSFENALVQNIAGGNTIVINAAAVRLLQQVAPWASGIFAHDWWAYQMISGAGGTVIFDPRPSVLYRQHRQNAIGENRSVIGQLNRFRQVWNGTYHTHLMQHWHALAQAGDYLTPHNQRLVETLLETPQKMLKHGVYRQSMWGQIGLGLSILCGRI